MNECFDLLGMSLLILTKDANFGCEQIKMNDKTTYLTHHGNLQHASMSFRPKNAPVAFQQKMRITLLLMKWQHASAHIDDVIVLPKAPKQGFEHIDEVLLLLKNTKINHNLHICFFVEPTSDMGRRSC